MYSMVRSFALSLFCLCALSSAALAQAVPARSIEGSGGLGFNSHNGIDNKMHTEYIGSASYARWGHIAGLVEGGHQSLGSTTAIKYSTIFVGFGARYYFHEGNRMAPYFVVAGGYDHLGGRNIGSDVNLGQHALYGGGGIGTSLYLNENIGIRPEIRYQAQLINVSSTASHQFNQVQGTISLFYQFGGKRK
jgi:hypothetical protein